MSRTILAMALLALAGARVRADAPPKVFSHPERIRYDGRCLTIDDRDILIFSGTFHYFRCPKALWRDRFAKIKAAGFNAIETYVPWNWSERAMPSSLEDFSGVDLSDFKEWLHMAQDEFGFYTIIRPGPYICAEWDGGGFPRWLLTKMPPAARMPSGQANDVQGAAGADAVPGAGAAQARLAREVWLRSDEPGFVAWSEHWLRAVCPVIAQAQITRRPPGHGGVILVQIENEYDFYKNVPGDQKTRYLRALYETAVAGGIEVPIFTCWTKQARGSSDPELSQVFDAFNSYPRFAIDATAKRAQQLASEQPDAPVMISELQGGWFSAVGGKLSEDQPGINAAQLNADTLLAIQSGATILNYYVLFGGTNFGLWPGRGDTATYDYDAPIREPGGMGEKYLAAEAIGRMLQVHGPALARSSAVPCQAEIANPDVTVAARAARGGDLYIFFRNSSRTQAARGLATVWPGAGGVLGTPRDDLRIAYELPPFGMKVFYLPAGENDPAKGQWLPRPVAGPARPDHLPGPVRPTAAESRPDAPPSDWVGVGPGQRLPELGVYDARPIVYSTSLRLDGPAAPDASLRLGAYPGDKLVLSVNGRVLPLGTGRSARVGSLLRAGDNSLRLLYLQEGQANFGDPIQDEAGLRGAVLEQAGGSTALGPWRLARSIGGEAEGWPSLGPGKLAGWSALSLDSSRPIPHEGTVENAPSGPSDAPTTWYRVRFELPSLEPGVWVPWGAGVDAAGDGEIWLNGHSLGRYWQAGPQRKFYMPECWLRFGPGRENVLTLRLSPVGRGVALRAVELAPYADQAELRR